MAKKKKESLSRTLAEVSKGVTKTVANDKSVSAKVRKQAKSDYRKASRISNSSASKNYISNSRLRRTGNSSTSAKSASMANRMRGESASQRNAGGNTLREIARSNTPKKNSVSRTYSELQNKTKDMNLTDTAVGRGMARAGLTAKGTAKEVYGGVKTTFSAIRDPNEERMIKADKIREQRGEQVKGNKYEGAYDKLRNAQRDNREQRAKDLKSASKMLESASADKEKAKKGLGKAGKFALDVESALLGMAGDAAVGAVTGTGQVGALGSMAVRSFGGAYDSAKKEGASDSQAALYAAVTGGKEVLTEKMFNVGKAFSGVFGKGLGDDVINRAAEKGAEKLAKKFGSEGAKNVILHGSNYLASALTEGLEEAASTASDPFVANAIYARAVGNPHSFDAGDTFYDFLVGAALGGLGGGIAEASNYSQGGQVKNVLGKDGLKEVADRVTYADEDSGISDSAKAISQMILNGEEVANAQALKLYKAAEAQEQKNFTQYRDAIKGATSIIERDNLISPSGLTVDESGQVMPSIGDNTNIKFQEARTEARNEAEKLQLKDDVAASIGDTIASIKTGIGVVDDIETIVRYPEAKAVYESVTGETLPSGRKALREYLYKKNAENRVQSAREETEFWKDQAVGLLSQTETEEFGGNGQAVFTKATENLDVNELGNSALTKVRTTINDYYNSAKLGIPFSTLNDIAKPEYDAVSEDIKREAYNAGILDSNDIYKYLDGVAVNKDESIKSSANKENRNANPGKLYVDADNAARKYFTNSQQKMWKALAEEFGIGIHIMDAESFSNAMESKGQETPENAEELPNGFYDKGEIYLNVETPDRATRYVFMHEFSHFLEQIAPKEFSELRKRMIDALIEDGSLERRLSRKRMQYGEDISQDDLIDEILADSTYEFLNDKDFANGIAKESDNLAQAIINAIRNLIRKIRNVLARDEYTPTQNANMYAQLGVLKDMEALWLDAVNAARENAAATYLIKDNDELQFSLSELNGNPIVVVDTDQHIFEGQPVSKYPAIAKAYIKQHFMGTVIGKENRAYVNSESAGEYAYPAKRLKDETLIDAKMRAATELENMLNAATDKTEVHYDYDNPDPYHPNRYKNKDYEEDWEFYNVRFVVGNNVFEGIINIKNTEKGKLFKDLTKIKIISDTSDADGKPSLRTADDNNSIANNPETVNAGKFSMKEPVEETRGLVALHNLKESDIKGTLELGGFPMPSIAIVKADQGHSDYGDYSAVFDKNTIDPERNEANKVYGGDAWTPTFPEIEYKVNENVRRRVSDLYYKIAREHGYDLAKGLQNYVNDFEHVLKFNNGESGMIQNAKDDTKLMQTYLVAEGYGKIDDVYKRTEIRISEADEELYNVMIDELGEELINKFKAPKGESPISHRIKFMNEHLDEMKAAYKKWLVEYVKVDDVTAESMMPDKPAKYIVIVRDSLKYLENGPVTVKEEYDSKATENAIRNAVKGTNYDKWVEDLFAGAEEKAGIYNGKDPFTDTGRRSFEQLHWDINLDNVVKAMRLKKNGETLLGDSLKAISQKIYANISEIQSDSKRLKKADEDYYAKKNEEFFERESDIVENIAEKYDASSFDNIFIIRDSIRNNIADCVRRGLSNSEILKELHRYEYSKGATMEDVEAIVQLVKDVSEMPTTYFEAKPERAVGLDEIKAMLTPDTAPNDIVEAMEAAGINVVKYKAGDDTDRVEKLNSIEGVRFSKKDSAGRELSEGQQEYFKNSKVRDENGNLKVVYHGTNKAGFTIFNRTNNFYTDSKDVAGTYTNRDGIYEGYLNITKPLEIDVNGERWSRIDVEQIPYEVRVLFDEYGISTFEEDGAERTSTSDIVSAVEDGIDEGVLDYDGIIFKNIHDEGMYGSAEPGTYESDVYVTFNSNQFKSIDNFNPTEDKDIRFSLLDNYTVDNNGELVHLDKGLSAKPQRARYTEERIDDILETYGSNSEKYAQAYITSMSPRTFLKLTLSDEKRSEWERAEKEETRTDEIFPLDTEQLKNEAQTPFLKIDSESGEVLSHEGRHRMLAMYNAGIRNVPVVVIDNKTKYSKTITPSMTLLSQDFGEGNVNYGYKVSVTNLIPTNKVYKDKIMEAYGNKAAIKFSKKEPADVSLSEKENVESVPTDEEVYEYMASHPEIYKEMWSFDEADKNYIKHKQNTYAELETRVEQLKQNQKKTHGKVLDEKSVRPAMNELVKSILQASEQGRGVKKTDNKMVNDCVANAKKIFTAYKNSDTELMITTSLNAAESMVESLKFIDDSMYMYYKDLRDYLKTVPIKVDDTIKGDIPDYNMWRKSQFGKLRLSDNGVPVDEVYAELCEMFPEMFSTDIANPTDQILRMAESVEEIQPYAVFLSSEEYDNLIRQTAGDLIDITVKGRTYKSMADRYEERIKAVKQRASEAKRDAQEKKKSAVLKEREKGKKKLDAEKQKRKDSETKLRADRDTKVQAERDKRKEADKRRKEAYKRRKSMKKLTEDYKWLSDRILKPTDDKHVPDRMVQPLAELLQYIDLETEYSKKFEEKTGQPTGVAVNLRNLRTALEDVAKSEESRLILEDEELVQMIKELEERIDGVPIYELDNSELDAVQALLHAIRTDVANANKAFTLSRAIDDTARSVIWEANEYKANSKNRREGGFINQILNESMVKPMEFFEHLGPSMKSAYMAMRKGMDAQSNHMKEARAFFADVFDGYGKKGKPGSKVQEWRGRKKLKEFELESGEKITLNPSQVMSLYCLSKREQAIGHICGQGICASDPTEFRSIKSVVGTKEGHKQSTTMVTPKDIDTITASLSDEQIKMANKLQNFMNTVVAEWGNETSLLMYDRRKFTEPNYFPIQTQDAYLDANFDKRSRDIESIKNFGFTKGTVINANNPIVIDDIFTVTAKHINQMMLYNAYAPAISDFTRIYNYREVTDNQVESVQAILADTYGGKIIDQYISKFMSDLQNNTQTRRGGFERLANTLLANYKKAAIGASPRVALQQPTAIFRALIEINPKYFFKMSHESMLLQKVTKQDTTLKEMVEHCPTAFWKSMGFNQVDMARDIEDIMMNNEWSRLDVLTMKMYGDLDMYTWTKIWKAIKAEQKDLHPDVEYESDEFWELCNDRAIEVFDKTQVVDSVFHRSDVMRSKELLTKSITSFMSEPTTTFNMFRSNIMKANDLKAQGKKTEARKLYARTLSVYAANAIACAMAAALADAMLKKQTGDDDDDDENKRFFEFWLANTGKNIVGNLNPLNMIPIAKNFSSYSEGWGATNMFEEGIASVVKDAKAIKDKANDPASTKKTWEELITQFAKDSSYITGIPIKNFMRYGAALCELVGINAFAAEKDSEGGQSKSLFGEILEMAGFSNGDDSANSQSQSLDSQYEESWLTKKLHEAGVTEGTRLDNVLNFFGLNKSIEEQKEEHYQDMLSAAKAAGNGYVGVERDEKIYSKATDGYTKLAEAGEFDELARIRRVLVELDVDTTNFDKKVESHIKRGIKKQIGEKGDSKLRNRLLNQLKEVYGYTDEQISKDVLAMTDTATAFQKALCEDNYDEAVKQLRYLRQAGLTYETFLNLYEQRWKVIDAKTTGTFNWPAQGRISSGFGQRWGTLHAGIDIAMPTGTEVVASDGGEVVFAGYNSAMGNYVDIKHSNGYVTRYQHLSSYGVLPGEKVKKGQYIASSGNTGNSTGPHLHFAVYRSTSHSGCSHSTAVDPSIFLKSS